jgi:flagellar protein FlaG
MSIQVARVGPPQEKAEISAVQPRPPVPPTEELKGQQLRAVEGAIDDTLPTRPPTEVLEQIKAAEERYQELLAQQRELHFKHDDTTNRVVVEVRDLEGNVLRTVPPSKALDIIAGGPLD